jgi:hypothetical protein
MTLIFYGVYFSIWFVEKQNSSRELSMYFIYRYAAFFFKALIVFTILGCMVWSLLPESGVDF